MPDSMKIGSKTTGLLLVCSAALVLVGFLYHKPRVDSALVAANNAFGFKLFKEVVKQDSGKNVFISPTGISQALYIARNGASGSTGEEIDKVLGTRRSLGRANQANSDLVRILIAEHPESESTVSISNALWVDEHISVKRDFARRLRRFYNAESANLDFGGRSTPDIINSWLCNATGGKVNHVIDRSELVDTAGPSILVANTVQFKGRWRCPFGPAEPGYFYLPGGKRKPYPMMRQFETEYYLYYKGDGFSAAGMPYGKGPFYMYVFLPDENSNLSAFCEKLNLQNWQRWMKGFAAVPGEVRMPRFKFEYDTRLKDALTALGMRDAFDRNRADFGSMTDIRPAWLHDIKHKTFIHVDEKGTDAGAATLVEARMPGMRMVQPFKVILDRPFFFVIRDNSTGTILFMGSVVDPRE